MAVTTGAITLRLPSDYQYSSRVNSVSGKIKTTQGSEAPARFNNNCQNELSISAVTGNVNIYQ